LKRGEGDVTKLAHIRRNTDSSPGMFGEKKRFEMERGKHRGERGPRTLSPHVQGSKKKKEGLTHKGEGAGEGTVCLKDATIKKTHWKKGGISQGV